MITKILVTAESSIISLSYSTATFDEPLWISEYLASLPDDDKIFLGFTKEDLIIDCQFAGSTCTVDNFTLSYNPSLGNCYTFNSGWDPQQTLFISRVAGYHYGKLAFDRFKNKNIFKV